MEKLTESQLETFARLRALLKEAPPPPSTVEGVGVDNDFYLLKFLRARKFNLK